MCVCVRAYTYVGTCALMCHAWSEKRLRVMCAAHVVSKMLRILCEVIRNIHIFTRILLFKVKSTYLSDIMQDNYKT